MNSHAARNSQDRGASPVVMMGAFPPPMGGAAKVNGIVFDALRDAGVDVSRIDLSAKALAHRRTPGYHLHRLLRNMQGTATALVRARAGATLYIVPDGGSGAWYTTAHVAAAGARYARLVVHHHTCAYIERRSTPVALLTQAHRAKATHVFLTVGMATAFQQAYGAVDHVVASNARFVFDEAMLDVPERQPGPLRLGHLSNLCRDKGFFTVADSFDALRAEGVDCMLDIAGPALEAEVEERLMALKQRHGSAVQYHGAVAGEQKRAFYRGMDIFLFPTRWHQEAAPIVVYEALSAGVPVVSVDRGMIREIVAGHGLVCGRDDDYCRRLIDHLRAADDGGIPAARQRSEIKRFMRAAAQRSIDEYGRLLASLGADPSALPVVASS